MCFFEVFLMLKRLIEACYCIAGEGEIEDVDGTVHPIRPGGMYVLDKHDRHCLRGGKFTDLTLVSVFNPPLVGTERHSINKQSASSY
ncbi:ectoine synthase [Pseudomonas sp. SBB6]|uniref:ectoine synthase n=1 Tax=Pseudomonas sp. SBB6 TaxID=2962032 RepID=UPI0020B8C723|nr:ectoine synthase [Pseudomonas sp. SBB6]MCP3750571.1 ectoine synthase [Pseudomonas sp. SBB6]